MKGTFKLGLMLPLVCSLCGCRSEETSNSGEPGGLPQQMEGALFINLKKPRPAAEHPAAGGEAWSLSGLQFISKEKQ